MTVFKPFYDPVGVGEVLPKKRPLQSKILNVGNYPW